jgi:hypothetical protein
MSYIPEDKYHKLSSVNQALEWVATWIEGSLAGETDERVIEFAHNMAASIRAGKTTDLDLGLFQIARLDLRPDDVLVLRSSEQLSMAAFAALEESVMAQFPGHRVIVLDGALELGVMGIDAEFKDDARTETEADSQKED